MAETVANSRQSPKISLVTDRIVGARLLEVVPDLDMFLTEDELKQASHLMLPVCTVRATDSINELLTETGAFAASVIDGMLVHRMRLRTQTGLRLLAPGDIITREPSFHEGALEDSVFAAVGDVSIALFDDHLLIAARRCPRLVAALLLRLDQQSRRATSQMMICQLPRVEDRVLTMMWLLAETWGRVTPAGTFLRCGSRTRRSENGRSTAADRHARPQAAERSRRPAAPPARLVADRAAGPERRERRRHRSLGAPSRSCDGTGRRARWYWSRSASRSRRRLGLHGARARERLSARSDEG